MNATTGLREQILTVLDARFASDGFARKKNSFQFRRRVSPSVTQSVHLNFGLYEATGSVVVNPSVGARHDAVERALIAAGVVGTSGSHDRATVARALAPAPYEGTITAGAPPIVDAIVADWESVGRQHIHELANPDSVIKLLSSNDPKDWGHADPGMRARLLVLFLDSLRRREDALSSLEQLELQLAGKDRMRPDFAAFATWFRGLR